MVGRPIDLSAKAKTQGEVTARNFSARGLRAHKNATRKIPAAERQSDIRRNPVIISAIRRKSVLEFSYNGSYASSNRKHTASARQVAKSSVPTNDQPPMAQSVQQWQNCST